MSFNKITYQDTPLKEIGWMLHPIDDGRIKYSYDELYLFMYLQHDFNRAHDLTNLSTYPLALWVDEDLWHFPDLHKLYDKGLVETYPNDTLTCDNNNAHIIMSNIKQYIENQIPDEYKHIKEYVSIFVWLNNLQYSTAIPKLLVKNEKTELFYDRKQISNKILLLNYLNISSEEEDLCEQVLNFDGISEYFMKELIHKEHLTNQHIKHVVSRYNKLAGY